MERLELFCPESRLFQAAFSVCNCEKRRLGPGIPDAVMERIYEPFFSTKQPGEGTGLGLFITIKIMEALGGRMEVESIEGEGTSFTLLLPIKPAEPLEI
ncbi:MAG: ATP-binding protein [Deltaproteobacteria bacterium]